MKYLVIPLVFAIFSGTAFIVAAIYRVGAELVALRHAVGDLATELRRSRSDR